MGILICETDKEIKEIKVYFQHYKSFEEASDYWYKRCSRVNLDKYVVIIEDGLNLTQKDIDLYESISIKNKVILCGNKELIGPDVVHINDFRKKNFPGTSVKYRGILGKRWLDKFDYISFLNNLVE